MHDFIQTYVIQKMQYKYGNLRFVVSKLSVQNIDSYRK